MKYTEGICEDGAAILCDGQPITISQILGRLNLMDEFKEENERYTIRGWVGIALDARVRH